MKTKAVKEKQNIKWFAIKAIWISIFMVLVFKASFGWFAERYRFVFDPQDIRCIPEYSFYLLKKGEAVERGGIYSFLAKDLGPFFEDGTWLGKYIIATDGDEVVINKDGIFVNGQLKTTGFLLAEKLGKKKESYYRTFTMPKNKAFFMGTGEHSYDSRYYGLIDYSQIIGEAIPLW